MNGYRFQFAQRSALRRVLMGAGALLVVSAAGASAQRIRVTVNGDPVQFESIGPQQVEGRVLVPVRGVLEKLGANVSWLPSEQRVIAGNGNMDIQLRIGERQAVVNGNPVRLDVPAQTIAGSTMVPLRFLGEALGADVRWNEETSTVRIHTGENPVSNPGPDPASGALRLRDLMPRPNSLVNVDRPTISAALAAHGNGVERGRVRIFLDGRNVTQDAIITEESIHYRPDSPLSPGQHTVRIRFADREGSTVERSWNFRR